MPCPSVVSSHDFEHLFTRLQDAVFSQPLDDPLVPEVVVVPSSGLARWLTLKLAQASDHRICANVQFQLPTAFIWQTCRKAMPHLALPERSAFALDTLSLAMLEPLQALRDGKFRCSNCTGEAFCTCRRILRHYVADDDETSVGKMYGLGVQLAHLYENYLIHRSRGCKTDDHWNWVSAWEAGKILGFGEAEHWQQAIWQKLTARDNQHLAFAIQQFCQHPQKIQPQALPQRVTCFGLASLPPLYLDFLESLAQHVQLHAFFFSPSMEYWGDLHKGEAKRKRLEDEPFSPLALWGRRGQPLVHALIDKGWLDYAPKDYPLPEQDTLLHCLQREILTLEEETVGADLANDCSLIIQHAPTPAREVEILHDTLLACFDADATLTPDDVLVWVSDMERYAPHIEAVFSAKTPSIPYSIADLTLGKEKSLLDGFLHWIKLHDHRFEIDWLLDFLHVPAFCRRFALEDHDIALIRALALQANMRWGYDEAQRQALGLWPTAEHTVRHGSLRYLYGFLGIPKGHLDDFGVAVSPLELASQDSADTLGKWMVIIAQLKRLADALQEKRPIEAWASFLQDEIERFFTADEEESRPLLRLLQQLYDAGKTIGFQGDIPFAIIQQWLLQHAPKEVRPGLFQGGVTFAAILAERVFPKTVIALLGMGQDDFPRQENRLSFDLLAPQDGKRHTMAGDPNRDEEDRYFFLQNVLAAKKALILSYVGQDPKTGEAKLPANVVTELLDWMKQKGIPEENIVKAHPVLAYDPIYFQNHAGFFTYDQSVARAMNHTAKGKENLVPLHRRLENRNAILPAEIRLESLVAFFQNPSQAFLQSFGIEVPETVEVPQSREPFGDPKGLDRYQVRQQILKDQLSGLLPTTSKALLRSQGLLPHGLIGDTIFAEAWWDVEPLAQAIQLEKPRPYAIALNLPMGPNSYRLIGQVMVREKGGVLYYKPGKLGAKDQIAFLLHHLALCASDTQYQESLSLQLGKQNDTQPMLEPLPPTQAQKKLLLALELYRCGLQKPLPFFPASSQAFYKLKKKSSQPQDTGNPLRNSQCEGTNAKASKNSQPEEISVNTSNQTSKFQEEAAQQAWDGNPFQHVPGDGQDRWHRYLYGDKPPFADADFQDLAQSIWSLYDDLLKSDKKQKKMDAT